MYKKKILLLCLTLALVMAGCGGKDNTENSDVTTEGSAVAVPTADLSDIVVEEEEKTEEESKTEPVQETEPAQEEYIYDESEELTCVLPKGFEAYPDEEGLYVHKSFPKDTSTISYVITDSDSEEVTREMLETDLEADYLDAYGDEVDVKVNEFKVVKIDGRKSLRIKLEYEFKGVEYEQLMYYIYNGADAHVLNFTQEKGGKWTEEFETCGESIVFE